MVSKKKLLGRIFELKTEEVTRGWRKMHNEELFNFYSSPNIVAVINARRMGWTNV
jgi:hypothetical protein